MSWHHTYLVPYTVFRDIGSTAFPVHPLPSVCVGSKPKRNLIRPVLWMLGAQPQRRDADEPATEAARPVVRDSPWPDGGAGSLGPLSANNLIRCARVCVCVYLGDSSTARLMLHNVRLTRLTERSQREEQIRQKQGRQKERGERRRRRRTNQIDSGGKSQSKLAGEFAVVLLLR